MNALKHLNKPAIVVGGGLNALGIVRSLGSVGVPLIVMDQDVNSPAMRSRYGVKISCTSLEGNGLIEHLLALSKQYSGQAVLFVTEEKTVVTVSEYRERLKDIFHLRLPEHERLIQLMHKQGFQELAEAIDAPVPKTVRLEKLEDLALVTTLKFPCVLKPSKKDYAYGARFKKAYKVESIAEVERLYHEIFPILADMVVQEWIEGQDSEIYFCLQYVGKDNETVASFTGRKIRSWPPRIGGTASCTEAWEYADELNATTSQFFRQVGFTGMGSMEYKRDERDGHFYMVEPTVARTDFQEEVATLNGVNLPYAAYCYELGMPVPVGEKTSESRIWRDAQIDRWSLEESGDKPDQRSSAHIVYDAYFRWSDPRPWLDFMLARICLRLGLKKPDAST